MFMQRINFSYICGVFYGCKQKTREQDKQIKRSEITMSTLIRLNPFREMAALQSAMDRMFDETWRNVGGTTSANVLALDVVDNGESYHIIANLPGVTADNINVSLHDGTLTIHAEITKPEAGEDSRVLLQERIYGKFARSINLPQPVNIDDAQADFNDGVLTLTLPKTPEVQPRQIPVRVSNGNAN
jgi:HSP20 family protein